MHHSFISQKSNALLLIIDLQAGLEPVINDFGLAVNQTEKLIKAAKALDIP